MKLKDVRIILSMEAADRNCMECDEQDVGSCYASDLISDLLTFQGPNPLLLTGLTNPQVIQSAEILDLVAICFVRGRRPRPETVALAEARGIPLFGTSLSMYESCGRLYANGVPPGVGKKAIADCQSPE